MANTSQKVRKQGMSFQLSANKRCLSAPDATSLHHCLKNKQPKLNAFSGKYPSIVCVEEGVANACI